MTINYLAISLFDYIVQLFYPQCQTWKLMADMQIFALFSFGAMIKRALKFKMLAREQFYILHPVGVKFERETEVEDQKRKGQPCLLSIKQKSIPYF